MKLYCDRFKFPYGRVLGIMWSIKHNATIHIFIEIGPYNRLECGIEAMWLTWVKGIYLKLGLIELGMMYESFSNPRSKGITDMADNTESETGSS